MNGRLIDRDGKPEDAIDTYLRPRGWRIHRPGQVSRLCASSSRRREGRGEALDHVLFACPPGSARHLGADHGALAASISGDLGSVIAKAGDLAALLTNLEDRDVLFIDEIHRLSPAVEENSLSGYGGFPSRLDHRRGGRRARSGSISPPSRSSAPPRGPGSHHALARPFRYSGCASISTPG